MSEFILSSQPMNTAKISSGLASAITKKTRLTTARAGPSGTALESHARSTAKAVNDINWRVRLRKIVMVVSVLNDGLSDRPGIFPL